MRQIELVVLQRDTQGTLIPDGTRVTLPEGSHVRITQELGDTWTVVSDYGQMFRIEAEDADALGKQPRAPSREEEEGSLEDRIWAKLKKCYDPEIPINIVDLGLVYSCEVREGAEASGNPGEEDGERDNGSGKVVDIAMTLTAPGCGMGGILADDVKRQVESLPEVARADVDLVFDPPWNQDMMSDVAKLELGMM